MLAGLDPDLVRTVYVFLPDEADKLIDYLANENFVIGFSPDCRYFND
jgi:hypothetical protein